MRRSVILTILASLSVPASAIACPESCLTNVGFSSPLCTSAPTLDTIVNNSGCGVHATFSIPIGALSLFVSGSSPGSCHPSLTVEDDFRLEGLPTGTPVTLSAVYHVRVRAGGMEADFAEASAGMSVVPGGTTEHTWTFGSSCVWSECILDTVWSMPVNVIVGTPFRMSYFVHGEVGDLTFADVHGQFFFDGLPAGAIVTSCNGADLEPVPATRRTWGAVKAAYR